MFHSVSHSMTKPTKLPFRPEKIQISLDIRPVWSESSLSIWRNIGSSSTHWAPAKTLIRLGGCPGWSESLLGAQAILLVLSWGGFIVDLTYSKETLWIINVIVVYDVAIWAKDTQGMANIAVPGHTAPLGQSDLGLLYLLRPKCPSSKKFCCVL